MIDLAFEWDDRLPRKVKKILRKMALGAHLSPKEDKIAHRWMLRAKLVPVGELS